MLLRSKKDLGEFTLHVPGVHNVLNATAAIAVGVGLDWTWKRSAPGWINFAAWTGGSSCAGVRREVSVIDDYGHHPTETSDAGGGTACGFGRCISFSRTGTRGLATDGEFTTAFVDSDSCLCWIFYAASEKPIEGISGEAWHEQSGRKARRARNM